MTNVSAGFYLPVQFARPDRTYLPDAAVTADKPPTRQVKLAIERPEAISRVTGQQLKDRDLGDLDDSQSLPELTTVLEARSLNDVIGFRGLVNNPFFGEPAVALYVDDVPYGPGVTLRRFSPITLTHRVQQFTRCQPAWGLWLDFGLQPELASASIRRRSQTRQSRRANLQVCDRWSHCSIGICSL